MSTFERAAGGNVIWSALRCAECDLSGAPRTFGYGNPDAEVAVVGINPSVKTRGAGWKGAFLAPYLAVLREVRMTPPPLSGAARAFLALSNEVGLILRGVYSTNAVKCVTPGNRPPHALEAIKCHRVHLRAELEGLDRLRAVLVFGRSAGRVLGLSDFGSEATVDGTLARARLFRHPIYVLRRWTQLDAEAAKIRAFLTRCAPTSLGSSAPAPP